jgi:uncharacterized protein YkwD
MVEKSHQNLIIHPKGVKPDWYNGHVKEKRAHIYLSILISLGMLFPAVPAQADDSGNVYDMIAGVNAVRSSNGLSPLETDGSLMASAQAHAEYMASTGVCSHTGSGGTTAKQRMVNEPFGNCS